MLFAIKRDFATLPYLSKLYKPAQGKDLYGPWVNELSEQTVYTEQEVVLRLLSYGVLIGTDPLNRDVGLRIVCIEDKQEQEVQCEYVRDYGPHAKMYQCNLSKGHTGYPDKGHNTKCWIGEGSDPEQEHDFSNDESEVTAPHELAIGLRCPKCGGRMVERTNRRTGSKFYGCLQWPKCNGTRREV